MKVYVAHVPFIANSVNEVEAAVRAMVMAYQQNHKTASAATIPVRPELTGSVRIEQA